MSINDQILSECEQHPVPETVDESKAAITRLIARAIRAETRNAELFRENEDLRAETLAWHARADDRDNTITITCNLETARRLWALIRPCNPYANPED